MGTDAGVVIPSTAVDPEIARRLRAIAKKLGELDAERATLILSARAQGASLREIAEVAGMSHVGIQKLIGRHLHPRFYEDIDRDNIE